MRGEPIPVGVQRLVDKMWSNQDFVQEVFFIAHPTLFEHLVANRFGRGRSAYPELARARQTLTIEHVVSPVFPKYASRLERVRLDRVTVDIPLVDTWDEAINGAVQSPVRDPAIDAWLLATAQLLFYQIDGYIFLGGIDEALRTWHAARIPFDTNLVYDIVLLDRGEELCRTTVAQSWRLTGNNPAAPEELGLRILGDNDEEFEANLDRMTVRLVPRPRLALAQFTHDVYWMPADGLPYLEMTLREAVSVAPRLGLTGSSVNAIDLLNPPVPFVREMPW